MSTAHALYRIDGTDRTVRVPAEFAARFGGMILVPEVVSGVSPTPSKTKTSSTNSSKEGK